VRRLVAAAVHMRSDGYHDEVRDPSLTAGSDRLPPEEDFAAMVADTAGSRRTLCSRAEERELPGLSVRGVEALLQAGEVQPALAPPDQLSVGVELFEAVTIRMSWPRRPRGIRPGAPRGRGPEAPRTETT
jgi:hypothetical protein